LVAELAFNLFPAGKKRARPEAILSEIRGRLADIGCADNVRLNELYLGIRE
jgi:hypothetical protein